MAFFLAACCTPAQANVPVPTVFMLNLPLFLGVPFFLAAFGVVTLLEAAAIRRLYRQPWRGRSQEIAA